MDWQSEYMTIKDVAAYLCVSTKTVRREIAAKHLKATRFGVQWRIARIDLSAYINGNVNFTR